MNTCVIVGRLTKDPEARYTQSGKAVTSFTVAIDDGWGDKKKTYFFPIVCWEGLAESCGNNLVKGQKVAVMGKLTQRTYEKDGQNRSVIEILAREVEFGEKPRGASTSSSGTYAGTAVSDEDIPF
ncbi:single-stranded DNA-binding protein [Selenomonas sp. TAMA-11512]|uniref:single-stranded DNA-binding protein n=1 Tax=Selenomonas sp. TAMA-11512 TaxID=3095337 RepID=UPI0030883D07|nr:single-stranded DNA-binding protein [Selenomonas sp. TAMA-11512]